MIKAFFWQTRLLDSMTQRVIVGKLFVLRTSSVGTGSTARQDGASAVDLISPRDQRGDAALRASARRAPRPVQVVHRVQRKVKVHDMVDSPGQVEAPARPAAPRATSAEDSSSFSMRVTMTQAFVQRPCSMWACHEVNCLLRHAAKLQTS